MRPDRLAAQLHSLVSRERRDGRRVVLAFGDCCSAMSSLENLGGVTRTSGTNCCEILLGRDIYRRLSHQGAFFICPEWAVRWRTMFETELGLDTKVAKAFMQELHRKIVYLDTGVVPEPTAAVNDCADYCGLPVERLPVSLDTLHSAIEDAISRLTPAGVQA
ncbi:MAG: DUF1638 domain-containing protein [candidate division Zixibacteria bacterium]|nr:DUF1638 domain-containing protein [candidate division Zixibacteria bacterium]